MLHELLHDLEAEQQALDTVLLRLDAVDLDAPTPAEGWTVRDQVGHLAFSEELAGLAVLDPDRFVERLAELLGDLERAESEPRDRARDMDTADLLGWWRQARHTTISGLQPRADRDRIPWVTGEMSALSFATARLMETWAHGQDVVDAVGATRRPTARLRHIAHLGVATRGFSYQLNGMEVPATPVRVDLRAPGGDMWSWGPDDATDRVRGSAHDLCLVVTQRRHLDDTDLEADGAGATEWLSIAQAFAGPPGGGRAPMSRTRS